MRRHLAAQSIKSPGYRAGTPRNIFGDLNSWQIARLARQPQRPLFPLGNSAGLRLCTRRRHFAKHWRSSVALPASTVMVIGRRKAQSQQEESSTALAPAASGRLSQDPTVITNASDAVSASSGTLGALRTSVHARGAAQGETPETLQVITTERRRSQPYRQSARGGSERRAGHQVSAVVRHAAMLHYG